VRGLWRKQGATSTHESMVLGRLPRMFRRRYPIGMSDAKSKGAAGEERAARLAQALRDNLRRRKAQAREATETPREARDSGEAAKPPRADDQ